MCQLTCGFFLHKSHTTFQILNRACQSTAFFAGAIFCVSNVKNFQIVVKKTQCLLSWDFKLTFIPCTNVMIVSIYIHELSFI